MDSKPPPPILPDQVKPWLKKESVEVQWTSTVELHKHLYHGSFGEKSVWVRVIPAKDLRFSHSKKIAEIILCSPHRNIDRLLGTRKIDFHKDPRLMNSYVLLIPPIQESLSYSLVKESIGVDGRLIQLKDIAEGLCFLNQKDIWCYHMRPENIALSSLPYRRCRLSGFETASYGSYSTPYPILASPCYYRAPEISGYTENERQNGVLPRLYKEGLCDSYGLGVITRAVINDGNHWLYTWDFKSGKLIGICTSDDKTKTADIPSTFTKSETDYLEKELIKPCLCLKPTQRITPTAFHEKLKIISKKILFERETAGPTVSVEPGSDNK